MTARRFAVAVGLGATVACNLVFGIDDPSYRVASDGGAGEAAPSAPARCPRGAAPPSRPGPSDGPDRERFTFAMQRIDLSGKTPGGAAVGYDLDGVCTCAKDDTSIHAGGPSCVRPDAAGGSGCDEENGIDNALVGSGIDALASSFGVALNEPTKHAACGRRTMLVMLDKYNGLADDPEVSVAVVASFGIKDPPAVDREDAGGCFPGFPQVPPWPGPPWPAKMDGTDVWTYRSRDFDGKVPLKPLVGWVRNFDLVLDGRPAGGIETDNLAVLVSDRILSLGSTVFTAHLVPLDEAGRELTISGGRIVGPSGEPRTAARFALRDGLLSGRVRAADLLTTLGSLEVSQAPKTKFLCDDPAFAVASAVLCTSVDSMAVPSQDFKDQPCNALSFVMQFDAVPAMVGRAVDGIQSDPCGVGFQATCP